MHRTTGANRILVDGKYRNQDQNPDLGIIGTTDKATDQNAIQEELCNIIEMNGGSVRDDDIEDESSGWHQIYDAIFKSGYITKDALSEILKASLQRNTCPPYITNFDVCSGLISSYAKEFRPDSDINTLSTGAATKDWTLSFDSSGQPVIFYLTSAKELKIISGLWNLTAHPGDSSAITLSVGGSYTPVDYIALCSTDVHVYLAWRNTDNMVYISKFLSIDIMTGSATALWSRSTRSHTSETSNKIRMIIANENYIAVSLANGDSVDIGILKKDNSSFSIGGGNQATSIICTNQNCKLVSNESHIFWIQKVTTDLLSDFYLCSAKITDPSTSDFSETLIEESADETHSGEFVGGILYTNESIVLSNGQGKIYVFDIGTDSIRFTTTLVDEQILFSTDCRNSPDSSLGFDGENIWYSTGVNLFSTILVKIKSGIFSSRSNPGNTLYNYSAIALNTPIGTTEDTYLPKKFIFDRENLFLCARDATNSKVFRVINPGLK